MGISIFYGLFEIFKNKNKLRHDKGEFKMLKNMSLKRIICLVCAFAITVSSIVGLNWSVKSDAFEKVTITVNLETTIKITNSEGETLIINGDTFGNVSGTMDILEDKTLYYQPSYLRQLLVRKSDTYIIEQTNEGSNYIDIDESEYGGFVSFNTGDKCKAVVKFFPQSEVTLEGEKQLYSIDAWLTEKSADYEISGMLYKPIYMKEEKNKLIVTGALGKTDISVDAFFGKHIIEGSYYLFGGETVLGYNDKRAFVKNAVKINSKYTKRPVGLYVRPVNSNKNMFLSWTKVIKAHSYIVYKRDYASKKYKKVAIRNGRETNYYIADIKDNGIYEYKVLAKTKKNGKGKKIGKLSYGVKAVPLTNNKENAKSVYINKESLSLKKGKKKTIKAQIVQGEKTLLDRKTRWISSNNKIAKVNKKTGKILAVRKGKCKIWAKAHNGKNSNKIVVRVHK